MIQTDSQWRKLFCMILFMSLLAALQASITLAMQKEQETPEQLVERGRGLLNEKKYGDARTQFKNALKLKSNCFEARLLLAVAYGREGKAKDAIAQAKEALKIKPNDVEALYISGLIYYETNKHNEAKAQVDLAIKNGARFPSVYALQGYLELEKDNLEVASSAFEEAIKLSSAKDEGLEMLKEQSEALKLYIKFKAQTQNDSDCTKPVPLNLPMPLFTEEARRHNEQGSVRLKLFVDEQGLVKAWIVQSHLKYGLDGQAVRAARALRFKPATYKGKPTSYWVDVDVGFTLR
jgi:TonB family protein